MTECIYSIDLTTNSNEILSISSDDFEKLYISNIDENGEEIPYNKQSSKNEMIANFFMVKILNDIHNENMIFLERLHNKKDIVKVTLHFTNGRKQSFELAKKRIAIGGVVENKYYLDYIIDKLSKIKTQKLSLYVKILLRIGIYQIAFLNSISDYAAVNETVNLVKKYEYKEDELPTLQLNIKEYDTYELFKRMEALAKTRIGSKQILYELFQYYPQMKIG